MKWVRTQESFLKTIKSALGINGLLNLEYLALTRNGQKGL
jgi:hypothetical protein